MLNDEDCKRAQGGFEGFDVDAQALDERAFVGPVVGAPVTAVDERDDGSLFGWGVHADGADFEGVVEDGLIVL